MVGRAVIPWEQLASETADDGTVLELRRRGHEFLIRAGGYDLMSSDDDASSIALAQLGCAHMQSDQVGRVLVGGLGMGFTQRAALDASGRHVVVVCSELNPTVVAWNREWLGALAQHPLDDPRTELRVEDVRRVIKTCERPYDAILLDVDNGPDALAHPSNDGIYSRRGLEEARAALVPGGRYCVWSFSDEPSFTRRLQKTGFDAEVHRVKASRKGRGRYHYVWVAVKSRGGGRRR